MHRHASFNCSTMFQIDGTTFEKAAKLFQKDQKSIDEDLRIIKNWVETQPHLPELMEDSKIRNFLLLNKYSIERTKQKIDMYYTVRNLIPDIFENSNPNSPKMLNFMDFTYCCVHPKLYQNLYRVHFIKPKINNQLNPKEIGVQCSNIQEVRLKEDCMAGDVIIFDMETVTLTDVTKINPVLLSKLLTIYSGVYSLRIHQVYIVNSPGFVGSLLSVVKSLVKPKIFDRIKVCEDCGILGEVFLEEDLPVDYGGRGASLEELNGLLKKKFEEYRNRFDFLDQMKVKEELRPDKLNNDERLGFYGNFKQLSVD